MTRGATSVACLMLMAGSAMAQQKGPVADAHPKLTMQTCTKSGGCTDKQVSVTLDSNWRWVHKVGDYTNCYTGSSWNETECPDAKTCAQNCALEGVTADQYKSVYGVTTEGSTLRLNFVTKSNVGSRLYLLEDDSSYFMFQMKNREIAFDVDVHTLVCGLNGAVYFVQMDKDGGMERFPSNKAGASLGTGYCDAQCPHDIKWIAGEANIEGWTPSGNATGVGKYGSCCTEFDLWEANAVATAYTAHACNVTEAYKCEGDACGDSGDTRFKGVCDKNGCDFQTYRLGDKTFFGNGSDFTLDTTKPVRVVTQFITDDGTDSGKLVEVRRHYVQDGKKIETPSLTVGGTDKFNSLSEDYCKAEVAWFQDGTNFLEKGGFEATGDAFDKGMVLALSLWDDHSVDMLWLDSTYPKGGTAPGDARGPCPEYSGKPDVVEAQSGDAYVTYANLAYGEIGTTDGIAPGPAPGPTPPGPTPSGCPGGSLTACIGLCPSSPAVAYQACVNGCVARCS